MTIGILAVLLMLGCATSTDQRPTQPHPGKQLAFDRNKGNCLACHPIDDGESPGNIGPSLTNLPARFINKQQLKEQIWDAVAFNPETSMPPFGRNRILTDKEIGFIVDYLWALP